MASFRLLDAEYLFTFKSQFCPDLTDATVLEWLIKLHSAVGGSASFCPGDKLSSDRDPLVYICSRWGLEAGRNTPYTHHCEFSALEFLALELFALSSSTILTLL